MDLHPTPFPGAEKRRPAANHATKKERDRPNSAAALTQSKQKRTFGRDLSSNVTAERPFQKPITAKPWKPSGVSRNTKKPVNKVFNVRPGPGGGKSGSNKKLQHVTFQETPSPSANNTTNKATKEDLVCTPVSSTEQLMQETPFHTAENCSKCKLDRLEISSYWLAQIKLAEATGKHFVSAAFFRLALECKAQPFVSLQNELKHYRARHGAISLDSLWDDLCLDYGLTSDNSDCDRIDAVLVEQVDSKCTIEEDVNFVDSIHKCLDYVIIDKPEVILEDLDAIKVAPKETVHVEHSGDGTPAPSSTLDSPSRTFKGFGSPSSNSVGSGSFKRSFMIAGKKSRYGDLPTNYDCEPDWTKNKGKTEEQSTGSHSDNNVNPEEGLKNQLKGKNKAEEQCTYCPLDDMNPEEGKVIENHCFENMGG